MEKRIRYTISVRELVNYSMLSGDIDSRFTTNASALDGIRLHRKIQEESPENYQSEVTLQHIKDYSDFELLIQGRADGIITEDLESGTKVTVDEIKTTKRPLDMIQEKELHSAQAKCYGYIYALQNELDEINIRLTYCHAVTEAIRVFENRFNFDELSSFFEGLTRSFEKKLREKKLWREMRNLSLNSLEFPFPHYRKHQREMAVTVYRALRDEKNIYLQAPTGIGKTISTLFPALKNMGVTDSEKIFYLTARTTIRKVAEDTLHSINKGGTRVKYLTITAKDKICFMEKTRCIPEYCPYAKGYFDRVRAAVEDILGEKDCINREAVEAYASKHSVCPFEFQLDISMESDIIICDYNYLFDPNVALKRLFGMEQKQDYVFLIDEAHNLPERAREMYSSVIDHSDVKELRSLFKDSHGETQEEVETALSRLSRALTRHRKKYLTDSHGEMIEHAVEKEAPEKLGEDLRKFNRSIEDYLLENNQDEKSEKLTTFYFEVLRFLKALEMFDDTYLMYVEGQKYSRTKLYCLDPASRIRAATDQGKSAVFFSATLVPGDYFRSLLAYQEGDVLAEFSSPFLPENRKIMIAPDVSTKYRNREYSYEKVADYIHRMISSKTGNYMVFFPSYRYMNTVYDKYTQKYSDPDAEVIVFQQSGDMSEEEREEFLERFEDSPSRTHAGFCVMGGVFSEGIDLRGERLIGVAIVGVGLPQVCLEREIINRYFKEHRNQGFEYAYVYPGINKVLQSAGRLIRTVSDRGVILLIDERYMELQYQRLLPSDYYPCRKINLHNIDDELDRFWNLQTGENR